MIAWMQRRPLVAALAFLAAVLVILIGLESGLGSRILPGITAQPVKRAAAPDARLLPSVVAAAPEQAYPETAARPLFVPTRRPAPAAPSSGPEAFARGQFVLQGVIAVGDARTALLKEKSSGRIHRVERGKEVNGITVEKIEPTEVTLAMNGEREKLGLVIQRPAAGAPGLAAAPASQAGPFGAESAAAAGSAPAGDPNTRPATEANPLARAPRQTQPAATPGGARNAPQSTQPMTPEELLARRRARRNQPTQ